MSETRVNRFMLKNQHVVNQPQSVEEPIQQVITYGEHHIDLSSLNEPDVDPVGESLIETTPSTQPLNRSYRDRTDIELQPETIIPPVAVVFHVDEQKPIKQEQISYYEYLLREKKEATTIPPLPVPVVFHVDEQTLVQKPIEQEKIPHYEYHSPQNEEASLNKAALDWPNVTEWSANIASERSTANLEHAVDRLTKRLQRVENTINRSRDKNTRLNRVFTGQFGELVRTAVKNEDTQTLNRLLEYSEKRSSLKQTEAPTEQQNNEQVSLQNNHILERQLENALETIEQLKAQQKNTEDELTKSKNRYQALYKMHENEERSRLQEPSMNQQRDLAHKLLNEYRAKVEDLTNQLTMQNAVGKYAINSIVLESNGINLRHEGNKAYVSVIEDDQLQQQVKDLENQLRNAQQQLKEKPKIQLENLSGVRVREQNGIFIVEDDPDEPENYHQRRYEELSVKYHNLEEELINAKKTTEQMRVEIIDLHGKKMTQKDTLIAYNEAKVRELQKDFTQYQKYVSDLDTKWKNERVLYEHQITTLQNELTTTKRLLESITNIVH